MPVPQDAMSVDSILADLGARTLHLVELASLYTDAEVSAPSRLPGWTRGHVLGHLFDNAVAFDAVLKRARDADDAGLMYPSARMRDLMIEAAVLRSAARHLEYLLNSAGVFAYGWRGLPADRLDATFSGTTGWRRPVRDIPWMRWREVVLHTLDLGRPTEFTAGDPLVARLLDESVQSLSDRPDAPALVIADSERGRTVSIGAGADAVRVAGTTADLALWLTGRSDGAALTASGPLPDLPPWL